MYHDLIKAAYHKPVDNTILNEEKLQPFPLKISMWQECSLERWYKKVLKALNCSSMTREKTGQKRKRVKLPLFRWYILFLKHCKAHKRKLWELISTFSRIDYNTQKLVNLYIPIMNLPRKKLENNPIHNILKNHLGINFIKNMKDLYKEKNSNIEGRYCRRY